jgi:protein-S-isoprenylcysteine O-methyltransferase Ste14
MQEKDMFDRISVPRIALLVLLVMLGASVAGCEVVGGIFKAGVWVGAIAVVTVVVLLAFFVGKMKG